MLAALVESLVGLGRKTGTAQILQPLGTESRQIETLYPDGTRVTTKKLRPARVQNVTTLDSFVEAMESFSTEDSSVVYCRLGSIVARIYEASDIDVPQDSIAWKFSRHPALDWFTANPTRHKLSLPDVRTLLRVRLGQITLDPPNLLQSLASVVFNEDREGMDIETANLRKLGKSITSKVTGIEALPESFRIRFVPTRLFERLTLCEIEVCLRALPDEQAFELTPRTGDVELAISNAENEIVNAVGCALDAAGITCPVIAGWRD